jgi:hypothetical protein
LKILITILMLFFSAALAGAERHKLMPSQFVGEWGTDLK